MSWKYPGCEENRRAKGNTNICLGIWDEGLVCFEGGSQKAGNGVSHTPSLFEDLCPGQALFEQEERAYWTSGSLWAHIPLYRVHRCSVCMFRLSRIEETQPYVLRVGHTQVSCTHYYDSGCVSLHTRVWFPPHLSPVTSLPSSMRSLPEYLPPSKRGSATPFTPPPSPGEWVFQPPQYLRPTFRFRLQLFPHMVGQGPGLCLVFEEQHEVRVLEQRYQKLATCTHALCCWTQARQSQRSRHPHTSQLWPL